MVYELFRLSLTEIKYFYKFSWPKIAKERGFSKRICNK